MKVTTWIETAQQVDVEVSLDDVMAEIAWLDAPESNQAALRLLSMCLGAVMKVPDALVAAMNDTQRKLIADRLREQLDRYMPANV